MVSCYSCLIGALFGGLRFAETCGLVVFSGLFGCVCLGLVTVLFELAV